MTVEVLETSLGEHLPLLASGKVREIYRLSETELLFVTTDRISGICECLRRCPMKRLTFSKQPTMW